MELKNSLSKICSSPSEQRDHYEPGIPKYVCWDVQGNFYMLYSFFFNENQVYIACPLCF